MHLGSLATIPRLLLHRHQMRPGPKCYTEGRRGGRTHKPLLSTNNEETSRSLPCKMKHQPVIALDGPSSMGAGCNFLDGPNAECRLCQNPQQAGFSIGGVGHNFFRRTQRRASLVPASAAAGSNIDGASCSILWWSVLV